MTYPGCFHSSGREMNLTRSPIFKSFGLGIFDCTNVPDDRAGLSKFSIRKRTIPRFGPSDCSLRCLALLRTQIFSDSVDEELYSSAFRTTVYIKFLFIHEQLSQIAQDAPSSTFMELLSADVCQFLLTKMTGQCVSSW
jgi:hypothetical protein